MANNLSNGRISLSPTEKEHNTSMWQLLATKLREGALDEHELLAVAAENLTYAHDSDYYLTDADMVPAGTVAQGLVDLAADFGVRLEIAGKTSEKW